MAKEPWEEDIYDYGEEDLKRTKKSSDALANKVLTILAVIFFIMVIVIVATMIYLSIGGSGKSAAKEGFLDKSAPVSSQTATSSSVASAETSNDSSASSSEGTIKVLAGEGEAAIAARAGISIAELERLNPSHMATGTWYADPGDVVKTR